MSLIGIDVGGTNTDGVLLDPNGFSGDNRGVISHHKSITTADISTGIQNTIEALFEGSNHSKDEVLAVTIGTTHFINAVIERDRARLEPVAVLRLCGPYSRGTGPFSNFPQGLTDILKCYIGYLDGGYHVDGNEIRSLDNLDILEHAQKIKELGINSVAITGIFSAINKSQEQEVADLIRSVNPDANIVMSHEVSGLGYLNRENAAILNASIMSFAAKILRSFTYSVKQLLLHCPILLTQNDGTVLTIQEAMKTPIKTFSSGATNSMKGAAFLCSKESEISDTNVMVVDIGGTTTDVGLLLANGFPRQASSHSTVGGVTLNFPMPHVESIGLGGGSIIRRENDVVTIGPDSVGSNILNEAIIFGGSVDTATDVTFATADDSVIKFGNTEAVSGKYDESYLSSYGKALNEKLVTVIDRMRISPDPLPVLLVGGGSFIAPLSLECASKVLRPPFHQVANAIGAALGKLSFVLQKIESVSSGDDKDKIIAEMMETASEELVLKGALNLSIKVVDIIYNPIPYVEKSYSFEIKVVGDIDYSRVSEAYERFKNDEVDGVIENGDVSKLKDASAPKDSAKSSEQAVDHYSYKPEINEKKEWIVSETDVEYIAVGAYILGCGGGGTPYPVYLELRNMLRNGDIIRVIDVNDTLEDGKYIPVASAGSPTIMDEQLLGDEFMDACDAACEYAKENVDGVLSVEIGGGNGLRALLCGASSKLDIPVVDCDLMGRAYPTLSQVAPCIFTEGLFLTLTSVSDGNGNKFVVSGAQSDLYVEKLVRAALSEVGAHVAIAHNTMNKKELQKMSINNSLSNCWRNGRSIFQTRQSFDIQKLPQNILKSFGSSDVGSNLFQGKIISIEKKLFKGHVYGEVIIEDSEKNKLAIPFKNENLVAKLMKNGSKTWETVASVPDLISVCYADTGEAVGTPEYRYGIMVFVLVLSPNKVWRTEKGMQVGGPVSFGPGFDDIEYKPIGVCQTPKSVIQEFSS